MSEDNPGFGGFMNNMMNPDVMPTPGPPPESAELKDQEPFLFQKERVM